MPERSDRIHRDGTEPNLYVTVTTFDDTIFEDCPLVWATMRPDFNFEVPIWEVFAKQFNWETRGADFYRFLMATPHSQSLQPFEDYVWTYRDPLLTAMSDEELDKAPPRLDSVPDPRGS